MIKALLAITLLFSFSAFASKGKKKAPTSKSTIVEKMVVIEKSKFKWTGTKQIGDKHYGTIDLKEGIAKLKEGNVVSGKFVVDMSTINVQDLSGKMKGKLEGHLKADDFFNVTSETGKTATLEITEAKDGKAKGFLTIKGIKKPIAIPYNQKGNVFKGTMTFDRTDYKITYNSKKFFLKELAKKVDKIINDNITLDFTVALK